MKKKIFVVISIFILVFLIFYSYKFFIPGNNKIIKDVNELDNYFLNIGDYVLEGKITINSNKNTNTYRLKESKVNGDMVQEIVNNDTKEGILIEYKENSLCIKNMKLDKCIIFEQYEDILNNPIDFCAFIEDYKNDSKKEVKEENQFYLISVRCKDNRNKYATNKKLYFNRGKGKIDKVEVKDINNNEKIIIEYSNFKLL